jgi:predicted branched-subunit amino acid permease
MKTRPTWIDGMLDSIPICVSFIFVFSGVGALSKSAGLTFWDSSLSTATIFAAPLQAFISGLMRDGSTVLLLSATLLANFRFALMGAVVKRYFEGVARWKIYLSMMFLSASTYAVTHTGLSTRKLSGSQQFAYFLGVAVPSYSVAVIATMMGYAFLANRSGSLLSHLAVAVLPIHFASLTAKRKDNTGVLICTLTGVIVAPLLAQSHALSVNILTPAAVGFGAAFLMGGPSRRSPAC